MLELVSLRPNVLPVAVGHFGWTHLLDQAVISREFMGQSQ